MKASDPPRLPPRQFTWKLIREPDGRFGIFSTAIGDYVQYGLSEGAAYATCRHEYDLSPAEAARQIAAAFAEPRLWYEVERNRPDRPTDWLDLQRSHYSSTPNDLVRIALDQRDVVMKSLHASAARLARQDWYRHAADGLEFDRGDAGWDAAARLAATHDFPVGDGPIRLKLDPYKGAGAWKLCSGNCDGYVCQDDVVRAFSSETCGKSMISDCPALDPGPCLKEAGHADACTDGKTFFGLRTPVRTAGFGDA
jgi:hypothetical protein